MQGIVFSWESSDTSRLTIDDTGIATLLNEGLVWVTCSAGTAERSVPVLIKPGPRPPQNHSEWDEDQASLNADGAMRTGSSDPLRKSPQEQGTPLFAAMWDRLFPTALAQQNPCPGYGDSTDYGYDELWSDIRNLVGHPRNRVIDSSRIGSVLPEQNNFGFSIPLHSAPGRGLGLGVSLNYNSRIWSRHGSAVTFNAVNGWPGPGFSLGFGRIFTYGSGSNTTYVLIEADGTRRYLGTGSDTTTATYQTSDGSHITFVGSKASSGALYLNDGTKVTISVVNNLLLPTRIRDRNGNYVDVAYETYSATTFPWRQAISSITDTLGRQLIFNYDSCANLVSIEGPGLDDTNEILVRFDYENIYISNSFSGLTVENVPTTYPYYVAAIKHIFFPATESGYLFGYSAYGMINDVSLRRDMSYDSETGAISNGTQNAYVSFNYPTTASSLSDAPAFSERTESPGGTYSYSSSTDSGAQTKTYTVARPDDSDLHLTRSTDTSSVANGLVVQRFVKTDEEGILAQTDYTYANDSGGSPQIESITSYDDAGNKTRVTLDYDAYGNPLNRREYGFQISSQWQVRRRTRWVYETSSTYTNLYLRSLVLEQDVYDAHENTSDGDDTLIAKTTYALDNYSAMGGMEGYSGQAAPPGHESSFSTSFTTRGNVTGVSQFKSLSPEEAIVWLRKIDRFGGVVKEENSCCVERSYMNDEGNYYSAPVEVTIGSGGTTLTSLTDYDFNTSLVMSQTDPRDQTVTFDYDAADRPVEAAYPSGATRTASYDDDDLTASQSVNFTDGGNNKTATTNYTFDGWGRVLSVVYPNGGQVNTAYDEIGRVESVTNPFQSGQTPGPETEYIYDGLGRTIKVVLPDSQTAETFFEGSSVTAVDQVNRKIKREVDGLGRLIKVVEQDASGDLTQETTYSYDLMDSLTGVNQGGQLRAFKYDALGRLLFERIPEQEATIDDGTSTRWSCKYTWNDMNQLATKTDARGVVITYGYDDLNRLTSISYNTSGASGVASTSNVSYTFDTSQSSATVGLLLSVAVGTQYLEEYDYDSLNRVSSITRTIGSEDYTTSYAYNTAGQLTELTYPSSRVVNINHDSIGRLSSLVNDGDSSNYLSSLSYNWAGQVTGRTLGSNIVEAFGYSSDRLQLTSQSVTQSSQTRLSLTYDYQAVSGEMGSGTTAGNADQLMGIDGTINGADVDASYTYDLQRRLVTSSQMVSGSPVERRFAYDGWGNRTGMWNAVSGGTQIQSVTLDGSLGIPTNRLESVTTNSVTANYTYDDAGNVTDDDSHTYTYDAEDRLVSVDGGSTATYVYDHENRRVKKTTSGSSGHYVWEGSQVLGEHNASTGAILIDYVYAGGQMIAKEEGGNRKFFLHDRLSVRAVITDGQGGIQGVQSHFPFGEEIGTSGDQDKHRLTSYERDDESGTDYGLNRQYSRTVGRFMQVDPVAGSIGNPQTLNRFAYVLSDPGNLTDPLGLLPTPGAIMCFLGLCLPPYYVTVSAGSSSTGGVGIGTSGQAEVETSDGSETEGQNSDGFGPFVDPPPADLKKELTNAIKGLGPGCTAFFGGPSNVQDLASKVDNATIDYWFSDEPIPNKPGWTFSMYWLAAEGVEPGSAVARTVAFTNTNGNLDAQNYNSIVLGVAFFDPRLDKAGLAKEKGDVAAYRRRVLVHEFFHLINNADDALLAERWGLAGKGYDVGEPSAAITEFLRKDCTPK